MWIKNILLMIPTSTFRTCSQTANSHCRKKTVFFSSTPILPMNYQWFLLHFYKFDEVESMKLFCVNSNKNKLKINKFVNRINPNANFNMSRTLFNKIMGLLTFCKLFTNLSYTKTPILPTLCITEKLRSLASSLSFTSFNLNQCISKDISPASIRNYPPH